MGRKGLFRLTILGGYSPFWWERHGYISLRLLYMWSISQYCIGSSARLRILTPSDPLPPLWLHAPHSDIVSLDGDQMLKPQEHMGDISHWNSILWKWPSSPSVIPLSHIVGVGLFNCYWREDRTGLVNGAGTDYSAGVTIFPLKFPFYQMSRRKQEIELWICAPVYVSSVLFGIENLQVALLRSWDNQDCSAWGVCHVRVGAKEIPREPWWRLPLMGSGWSSTPFYMHFTVLCFRIYFRQCLF